LRTRSLRSELRVPVAATLPEPSDDGLVATDPAPPTMSRRGALALVGGGALFVAAITAGQTVGGPLRDLAVLLPRGREDFPVNRTAAAADSPLAAIGAAWRLRLGARTLSRADLLRLPQHTARLPIACVEGWSTVQDWTGVPLRDLAALVGVPSQASAFVESFDDGPFGRATLSAGQVLDPDALLALRVNGADLTPDHGYPARVIVPALPGVHCTKWVRSITFRAV
jgi:DMSO/TMAO reductase YedYZ molybdopterin-dependent catalytic subunit